MYVVTFSETNVESHIDIYFLRFRPRETFSVFLVIVNSNVLGSKDDQVRPSIFLYLCAFYDNVRID